MGKLPIALQLYSVREDLEKDFEGTLKAVKAMGYEGVEFAGLYGRTAEEVKAACDANGLIPYSAHISTGALMENVAGVVGCYAEIGCKYIAIPWAEINRELPGADGYKDFLKDIKTISNECKKHGIQLLYHNHDFEFEKIDGKNKLDILYDDTLPFELMTEIDTCWAKVGGEDPADYIRKYTGRAPVVHLKDFVGGKTENMYGLIDADTAQKGEQTAEFELRPVGCGVQDVTSIIKAAEDAGAQVIVIEQDDPSMGKSSMECVSLSLDNVKKIY